MLCKLFEPLQSGTSSASSYVHNHNKKCPNHSADDDEDHFLHHNQILCVPKLNDFSPTIQICPPSPLKMNKIKTFSKKGLLLTTPDDFQWSFSIFFSFWREMNKLVYEMESIDFFFGQLGFLVVAHFALPSFLSPQLQPNEQQRGFSLIYQICCVYVHDMKRESLKSVR